MTLAGGAADKIGNRYEGRWTIYCMIDVLDEKADSIKLEIPGEDGFEFYLKRNNLLEYHQVKRQKAGYGHWTLNALQNTQTKVLSDFWDELNQSNNSCVFVSTQDADQLNELANFSRAFKTVEEFEQKPLAVKRLSDNFSKLRDKWGNCSSKEAYIALKRIRVETVGEDFLIHAIDNRIAALLEGDAQDIRLNLGELIAESIHKELTAYDIWHYLLYVKRYNRRDWGKDPHVLTAVEQTNNYYISTLKDIAIAGKTIHRLEADTAVQKLTASNDKRGILLTGEAGVGKSGVMLQIVEKLNERRIPLLAFRVDRLEPKHHPDILGQQSLQLPSSPATVLANIAKNRTCVLVIDQLDAVSLASGRHPDFFDCIARIIEQAEAHPNIRLLLACRKFDLENDNRIKKLSSKDGILDVITVNYLEHYQVKKIVKELHLDPRKLREKQLKLLSIPLHLNLLAEIARNSPIGALNFETAKDLYDCFQKRKKDQIRERSELPNQWVQVVDTLCTYMSNKQILSAPENIIRQYEEYAQAMASEHILIWQEKRVSFFHENFFDYAFADSFSASGQSLVNFLQSDEQHLFKRTQVRQILLHEREADFTLYLEDLHELLTHSKIRFHIKQVIVAFLGTLNEPKEEEWEVINSLIIKTSEPLAQQIWQILRSSIGWFNLLYSLGIIQKWLNSEEKKYIDQAISILSNAQSQMPEKVVELVEPFVGKSQQWLDCLSQLVQFSDFDKSRSLFQLFLRLIQEGAYDEQLTVTNYGKNFWLDIHSLSQKKPAWACEAISCYLNRHLKLSIVAGQPNPFDLDSGILYSSQFDIEVLISAAHRAPRTFVEEVLPFIFRIVELTVYDKDSPSWKDIVWAYRPYGGGYDLHHNLLSCMEIALRLLAVNDPEQCSEIINQKLRDSNFETIQYLLIRTYAANGKRFANDAVKYLVEQPIRLETGYHAGKGNIELAPFWATRQLLEAILPYCPSDTLLKLETLILNFYPRLNKIKNISISSSLNNYYLLAIVKLLNENYFKLFSFHLYTLIQQRKKNYKQYAKYFLRMRGYGQFVLLDTFYHVVISEFQRIFTGLALFKIASSSGLAEIAFRFLYKPVQEFYPSKKVTLRLYEWQRKFLSLGILKPTKELEQPKPIVASFVGSPIPYNAIAKMTDEQWLKAIAQYKHEDAGSWFEHYGVLKGGAWQLASSLEKRVKEEPDRFARLIWQFPDDTNIAYFEAVLRGISDAKVKVSLQTAFSACQRCHQLPKRPCGRWISWLIGKLPELSWSSEALNIVIYYAMQDPDPKQEMWRTPTSNGDVYYGGNVFEAGMNSTRGSAVLAIAKLIFADQNRSAHFQDALQQIVRDSSIAVRACAAEALTALLNYDRNLAVKLFQILCDTEDVLLGTRTVEMFIYYAPSTHFHEFYSLIERMLKSQISEVQKVGARQACVASLRFEDARPLAEKCLSDRVEYRLGASEVFVANLISTHLRQFCEDKLIQLFYDSDDKVRSQAARCFLHFKGDELVQKTDYKLKSDDLGNYVSLINNFVESPAFYTNHNNLVLALEKTTAKLPEITYMVCKKFVENVLISDTNKKFSSRTNADMISQLTIRLYSQNRKNLVLQSKCLDLVDKMAEIGVYGLNKALEQHQYER